MWTGAGRSSMRLNFAGVPEEDIGEGIGRIGKVVREQVGLFGTLTGAKPAGAEPPRPADAARGWPRSCSCRGASSATRSAAAKPNS